jgi:hypothetical protein
MFESEVNFFSLSIECIRWLLLSLYLLHLNLTDCWLSECLASGSVFHSSRLGFWILIGQHYSLFTRAPSLHRHRHKWLIGAFRSLLILWFTMDQRCIYRHRWLIFLIKNKSIELESQHLDYTSWFWLYWRWHGRPPERLCLHSGFSIFLTLGGVAKVTGWRATSHAAGERKREERHPTPWGLGEMLWLHLNNTVMAYW